MLNSEGKFFLAHNSKHDRLPHEPNLPASTGRLCRYSQYFLYKAGMAPPTRIALSCLELCAWKNVFPGSSMAGAWNIHIEKEFPVGINDLRLHSFRCGLMASGRGV